MSDLKTSFDKNEINLETRASVFPIAQVTAQHELTIVSVEKKESNAGRAYVQINVDVNGKEYAYYGNLLYFKLLSKEQVVQLAAATKSVHAKTSRLFYEADTLRDLGMHDIVKDSVVEFGDEETTINFTEHSKLKIVGVELFPSETNPLTGDSYGQPHPSMSLFNYREYNVFTAQRAKDMGRPKFFEFYDFLGHLPSLKPHIKPDDPNWWSHRLILVEV